MKHNDVDHLMIDDGVACAMLTHQLERGLGIPRNLMSDDPSGTTSKIKPKTAWRRLCSITDEEAHAGLSTTVTGDRHKQLQGCVENLDLGVNPASPYDPKRRF